MTKLTLAFVLLALAGCNGQPEDNCSPTSVVLSGSEQDINFDQTCTDPSVGTCAAPMGGFSTFQSVECPYNPNRLESNVARKLLICNWVAYKSDVYQQAIGCHPDDSSACVSACSDG